MDMSKSGERGKAPGAVRARQPFPSRDVPAIVGHNLKKLRKAQGHSLERLAELSGVSRAMLGQIETAKSVPTVSLLWKIADALGVSVTDLIATRDRSTTVVLTKERTTVFASSGGSFTRRPLFPLDRLRGSEFYELRIGSHHREEREPYPSGTQKNLVVAQGMLSITIGEGPAIALAEGDAIVFEADVAHSYENLGEEEVLAFLVLTHRGRPGT
jgi:transcriptional regulator with XRE-family HTH domain